MNAAAETARLHASVEGRVQGVGYRAFVEFTAAQLDLTGWVRNRWNGDVELVAEGERPALEQLLIALRRGPRAANVTTVQEEWLPASGEFIGFNVHRSA